jgi:O-antigen biosynthesis protein WbqP
MYSKYLKRWIDVMASILLMILFSWLFLIIIILVKMSSKGSIFFKQKRIGSVKTEFYILKFRTMFSSAPSDVPTHLLENPEQYITRIGKFLRKTSLDELPQLINILKGEMSFVGPRPALWNQFDLIDQRDRYKVNELKPGLTGWAQVNGRDEISIETKAKLDGEYVNNIGIKFDAYCIVLTVFCIIGKRGYKEGIIEKEYNYEESSSGWS